MATDKSNIQVTDDATNTPSATKKKPKRTKNASDSATFDDIVANGHDTLSSPSSTTEDQAELPKPSVSRSNNESTAKMSNNLQKIDRDVDVDIHLTKETSLPIDDSSPISRQVDDKNKYKVELTEASDDEEIEEREHKRDVPSFNELRPNSTNRASSFTPVSEQDTIEIHEFTLADLDAYLDIYVETIQNRLIHFLGDAAQIQQFRQSTKERITTNSSSREFKNVLLGKLNSEVVAAALLSFPGEQPTVSNNNLLQDSNSCITSIRRWMVKNANYMPVNMEECYIEMIGVKAPYRKQGIGAAMLECVEHFARQAGALFITVHVNGRNLRDYFSRLSFNLDNSDSSAFWKWIVEKEGIIKMSKAITPYDENNDYSMDNGSNQYNSSIITGSEGE